MELFSLAAKDVNIDIRTFKGSPILQYSKGKKRMLFYEYWYSELNEISRICCDQKCIAKSLLKANRINTPKWSEFTKRSTLKSASDKDLASFITQGA